MRAVVVKLSDHAPREPVPGFRVRFVHSEHMTQAYWDIDAGAALPEHGHVHEQVTQVIEGVFELTVEGETTQLEPGLVAVIPSGARHSGRAVTACRIIDAFSPVREDYR
jgi:quercetin dioxygenase-like cupin family protein